MIILEMIPSQSGVRQIPCRKSFEFKRERLYPQWINQDTCTVTTTGHRVHLLQQVLTTPKSTLLSMVLMRDLLWSKQSTLTWHEPWLSSSSVLSRLTREHITEKATLQRAVRNRPEVPTPSPDQQLETLKHIIQRQSCQWAVRSNAKICV